MESDSVRTIGDKVLVDLWIEGKFRAISVSRQAIEAYLQLAPGDATALSENDRREFVRTHLSLVVSAATGRLREAPGAETISIDQLGGAVPREAGERRLKRPPQGRSAQAEPRAARRSRAARLG